MKKRLMFAKQKFYFPSRATQMLRLPPTKVSLLGLYKFTVRTKDTFWKGNKTVLHHSATNRRKRIATSCQHSYSKDGCMRWQVSIHFLLQLALGGDLSILWINCMKDSDTKVEGWQVSSRTGIMTMTEGVTWKQLSRASVDVVRA